VCVCVFVASPRDPCSAPTAPVPPCTTQSLPPGPKLSVTRPPSCDSHSPPRLKTEGTLRSAFVPVFDGINAGKSLSARRPACAGPATCAGPVTFNLVMPPPSEVHLRSDSLLPPTLLARGRSHADGIVLGGAETGWTGHRVSQKECRNV
jgi:hypothetical protein